MGFSQKSSARRGWLRNAFALDAPDTVVADPFERAVVDRVCAEIVRRRLATPALLFLEMHRPFNYMSAQMLHFFEPVVSILADTSDYRNFARFLEQRGSVDYLIGRIQSCEDDRDRKSIGRSRKND